ncbi:sigma-54-dependent Fis family transcriptional regulator [Candidatus Sumerlaeota bacterium]|nr:sigma-54-dependent Fis family transcriptional regulator [Candidatus Sumerlaeota bacterium]
MPNTIEPENVHILVADDEPAIRDILSQVLGKDEGYTVDTACDGTEAIDKIHKDYYDIVFVDLRMPGADGIEVVQELKRHSPDSEAVIITAYGTISIAVEAVRAGAYDFLTKPFHIEEVKLIAQKIIQMKSLKQENVYLRERIKEYSRRPSIIGKSEAMQEVFHLINSVANTDATVLIKGESGTGKELVAKEIHYNSRRANKPLVIVNCAAIPEELLESELFGHVKGAFTGATSSRVGKFEYAHGGTIFLDEIGDMSPRLQAKILRIIEEREFEPVGSVKTIKVDVRILAATNKDLELALQRGEFREDLFYRLNVVPIQLPPLRERTDDIPYLIRHFISIYNKKVGGAVEGFTPRAIELLQKYQWPGNVRELEHLVEQMIIIHQKGMIDVEHLPPRYRTIESIQQFELEALRLGHTINLNQVMNTIELNLIQSALKRAGGVKSKAAELLGLKRTTLIEKMRKYNIEAH